MIQISHKKVALEITWIAQKKWNKEKGKNIILIATQYTRISHTKKLQHNILALQNIDILPKNQC